MGKSRKLELLMVGNREGYGRTVELTENTLSASPTGAVSSASSPFVLGMVLLPMLLWPCGSPILQLHVRGPIVPHWAHEPWRPRKGGETWQIFSEIIFWVWVWLGNLFFKDHVLHDHKDLNNEGFMAYQVIVKGHFTQERKKAIKDSLLAIF